MEATILDRYRDGNGMWAHGLWLLFAHNYSRRYCVGDNRNSSCTIERACENTQRLFPNDYQWLSWWCGRGKIADQPRRALLYGQRRIWWDWWQGSGTIQFTTLAPASETGSDSPSFSQTTSACSHEDTRLSFRRTFFPVIWWRSSLPRVRRQDGPGLFHVGDGRAWTMSTYTQGAAALYPGLCSSALTARAGHCIFCEQVVRANQEQFHFGYIKLDTLPICSTRDKKKENGTKYIVPFLYI